MYELNAITCTLFDVSLTMGDHTSLWGPQSPWSKASLTPSISFFISHKCGMVMFQSVCLSVYIGVCLSVVFQLWQPWSRKFTLVCMYWYVFRISRSVSYTKVVGSRSRSQERNSLSVYLVCRRVCLRLKVILLLPVTEYCKILQRKSFHVGDRCQGQLLTVDLQMADIWLGVLWSQGALYLTFTLSYLYDEVAVCQTCV